MGVGKLINGTLSCRCFRPDSESYVAARALATYLIPGCVGRGVRLGSEGSSVGGGGGVWKCGNLEIMKFGLKWVHMARYGLILPPN